MTQKPAPPRPEPMTDRLADPRVFREGWNKKGGMNEPPGSYRPPPPAASPKPPTTPVASSTIDWHPLTDAPCRVDPPQVQDRGRIDAEIVQHTAWTLTNRMAFGPGLLGGVKVLVEEKRTAFRKRRQEAGGFQPGVWITQARWRYACMADIERISEPMLCRVKVERGTVTIEERQ